MFIPRHDILRRFALIAFFRRRIQGIKKG